MAMSVSRELAAGLLVVLLTFSAALAFYNEDEPIRVHLVPHTHDDVGWLKTVDEYFIGANNSIQHAGVQYILDTVVQELQKNPDRTFIYVEMAFFTRWWNEQTEETKNIVKDLVHKKQLEFINAGWCMNDEAGTHYNAIIDQMTLGLEFVRDNFGDEARPKVAWHIDPFGHSSVQAAMFAKMGYDGFFFARIDYDDKKKRSDDSTLEMIWSPSPSLGEEAEIFTGVLFYGYGPPPGFCWDVHCSDLPIQDDRRLFDYNVEERVDSFVKAAQEQAKHYRTNEVMFTMGSDFQYEDALQWYKNLDKLIYYVNKATKGVEVFYSTPSRYVNDVHNANKTWTVKTDDFFPYADNPYAYWTGYFTSRPALKGYTRKMNSLLQTCKQFEAITGGTSAGASSMALKHAMGVDQHHDAVSGTEKQHVADDYAKRLHIGQVHCQELINEVAVSFFSSKTAAKLPDFQFCEYLNVSACSGTETDSFNIVIYNPIGRKTPRFFQIPVNSQQLSVIDENGKTIDSQINTVPDEVKVVRGDRGNAPYEIVFGDTLGPLEGRTYFVRPAMKAVTMATKSLEYEPKKEQDTVVIENNAMALIFNSTTGRLMTMENKLSSVKSSVDQQFFWWNASAGNNINSSQASGAYIFRPNGTAPFMVNDGNVATISVVKGPIVQEVRQVFTPWLSQIVRLYTGFAVAEFHWLVGPIPFEDGLGKEIISRFSTDLDTKGVWYTDANGREMQKRVRNFRPTWKYNNTEPVAGNYYPVNSRIYIRDEDKDVQFTVLTDRSQGGSSLNDGQVELMVHRRLLHDDGRGVGEPLNETGRTGKGLVVRGRHLVVLDHVQNSTVLHRILGELLMLEPVLAFMPNNDSYDDYVKKYYTDYIGMNRDLPYNVHLLTLQALAPPSQLPKNVLLRLEHQFEIDEAPLNNTVNITLDNLFYVFNVTEATELTLGGNAELSKVHRLHWNTMKDKGKKSHRRGIPKPLKGPNITVELKPMEIRTFNLTVEFN